MEHNRRYNGTKLGPLMAAQGRQGRWLAKQVGISEASMSRIMSGKQSASEPVAERVAALLQIPLFLAFDLLESPDIGRSSTEAAA